MEIFPIAFDSLGVRSMATIVKVENKIIFIDPYASLAPLRYGLKPSRLEIEILDFYLKKIYEIGKICDIVIITHYHYDHHPIPKDHIFFESFKNAKFLIKDFRREHNSARIRGSSFLKKLEEYNISFDFADGKSFSISDSTSIIFSNPVWHGEINSKVGRVIMVLVQYGSEKFIFGSDAQLLIDENALNFVINKNPRFIILDGFPTIFLEMGKIEQKTFVKGLEHIRKLIEKVEYSWIIVDHHLLRDLKYRERFPYFSENITTAAEYYDLENLILEAKRKEIYNGLKIDLDPYIENCEKIVSRFFKDKINKERF